MNRRQRKKKEKNYLPLMIDEFTLLSLTDEERKKALDVYAHNRERSAYKKKYSDLKEGNDKLLFYTFPTENKLSIKIEETLRIARQQDNNREMGTRSYE